MSGNADKTKFSIRVDTELLKLADHYIADSTVQNRMDFKLAVELSKLAHVIAYTHEVDGEALRKLHLKCLEEVKRINGAVDFESAYKYQKCEN